MKVILIILSRLVFAETVEEANKIHRCQQKVADFEFDPKTLPKNRIHLFDYCEEHAGNTCCHLKDIDKVRARVNSINNSEVRPTDKCIETTKKVFCSGCDADVGTGRRDGLCMSQC